MKIVQRLRTINWLDPDVESRARRAGPVGAGVCAGLGSLIGTATGVGGAIGAGVGGCVGALLGYAYAGLCTSISKNSPAET